MIKKEHVDQVLDLTVLNAYLKSLMLKMFQIAAGCVSDNHATKPTMICVQEFLENIILEEPSKYNKIKRGESSGTKDI